MSELSYLKINESQIPIDAYKSIVDHYVSFLKYFYGNEIDLGIKEGSQILQAIKKNNQDINSSLAHDFHERVNKNRFDRKTYKDYHQPIDHLYKISCMQKEHKLQDFTLFFDEKNIPIGKKIHDKLSHYYKENSRELTSIIGSIHLIADKDEKLKIKVTDKEDKKEINGIIQTNNKEEDAKLFEKIRIDHYGKEVLISGILSRNQITFEKKNLYITKVEELKNDPRPLTDFEEYWFEMTDNTSIYYDANIFLSFFKKEENSKSVKFLFEEGVILNKHTVYFSTYVQLEAMFLFGTTQSKGDADIFILKSIFEHKLFTKITLSEETINICYELYKKYNIEHSPRDIIHVASAIQSKCTYLVTLDKKFIKTMQSVEDEDIPKVLNPEDLRTSLGLLPYN